MRYIKLIDALTLRKPTTASLKHAASAFATGWHYADRNCGWYYLKPTKECRTGACLVAMRDDGIKPPQPTSVVRYSAKFPLVWRSDAPLGSYYTAGLWCALSLRKQTGCAVFVYDKGLDSAMVLRDAPDAIKGCRYVIGLDLPWHRQIVFNQRCSLTLRKWAWQWQWERNSLKGTEKPFSLAIGTKAGKPAFSVSTGHLHGGTRAETLNLDHLAWTHKTLLEMMTHEKRKWKKKHGTAAQNVLI